VKEGDPERARRSSFSSGGRIVRSGKPDLTDLVWDASQRKSPVFAVLRPGFVCSSFID